MSGARKMWLVILPLAALVIAVGAFLFGWRQPVAPPSGGSSGGKIAPQLPANHPPVSVATPPPGVPLRTGKVDKVDTERQFTDYRVGSNSVLAIFAEADVMWLGTSGGIVRYDTVAREFKTFDSRDGLRANGVLYVGKLQGHIAAGTYGGGLALLAADGKSWEHITPADGLADPFIYDAVEAGGDVWIATGSGVNRIRGGAFRDPARWDLFNAGNTSGGLPHNRVFRVVAGKDGAMWFATGGGVARYQNDKWSTWSHADGVGVPDHSGGRDIAQKPSGQAASAAPAANPNQIAALEMTRDGVIWAGTRGGGVARFDGKGWTNLSLIDGLPSNQISSLHRDRDGRLWVGTRGGLAYFKDGKLRPVKVSSALLAQGVLSVMSTRTGDLWVGGFGGVTQLRSDALK